MFDNLANNFSELETHLLIWYMGAYGQFLVQKMGKINKKHEINMNTINTTYEINFKTMNTTARKQKWIVSNEYLCIKKCKKCLHGFKELLMDCFMFQKYHKN